MQAALRPMNLGEILDRTFEIYRKKFLLFAGIAALPAAVKTAWYLQCQQVWKRLDRLGAQIAQDPEGQTALDSMELTPFVKQLLGPFKRMQMT